MKMTSEVERIIQQMQNAFDGEAWHGPALAEILGDVDAKMAATRPVASAHTIWELTLHIMAWEEVIRRRLGGEPVTLPEEQNFPKIADASEAAWRKTVEGLKEKHKVLLAAVSVLPLARLEDKVPGKDYNVYTMLHGSAQHVIYHAGQIVMLKRALDH